MKSLAILITGSLLSLGACVLLDTQDFGPQVRTWLEAAAVIAPISTGITAFVRAINI